jgi:asparagine synthase (glutamine-hydrolysing)
MCGILVVVAKDGRELDLPACRRALSTMSWRGPDLCASSSHDGRVFLGQTVLSLTGDISGGRGEHLSSSSGRWRVAFNGEIYNYESLSKSRLAGRRGAGSERLTDTEVLVDLHEVARPSEIPALLDGMFAYAALDSQEGSLRIARDVQGEKSLYVYEDAGLVVISSEVRAILSLAPGAGLDVQALRDYFHTRHLLLIPRTVYRGIRQVLPGRLEKLDLRTMRWTTEQSRALSAWIDPARMEKAARRSEDDLADELESLLRSCVKEMVPRGRGWAAVVSGGVDSSLLASYALEAGSPELLVAVNHPGKDRISSDLSGFEKALGRPIQVLNVGQLAYGAEIARCQLACESPLPSHSFVPQSMQSAFVRAAGARVLFGGEGGDEYFGGYDAYAGKPAAGGRFSPSPYTAWSESPLALAHDDAARLQAELADAWTESLAAYAHVADADERIRLAMMYCDAAHQLAAVGLRGSDLMSMMWSVETRSVLVRRPVVEFALNLPLSAKLDLGGAVPAERRTKTLLKKLFLRRFPKELLVEKQGFAGFPNESAAYLGDVSDYLALEALGVAPSAVAEGRLPRAAAWKLANVEWFLRGRAPALKPLRDAARGAA